MSRRLITRRLVLGAALVAIAPSAKAVSLFWVNGSPNTPLPGMAVWQQFPLGMFQTSGGSAAGNGDSVGQWVDQSGNGRDLLQATSGSRMLADTTYGGISSGGGIYQSFNLAWTFNRNSFSAFVVAEPLTVNLGFFEGSTYANQIIYTGNAFALFVNGATGKLAWWDGTSDHDSSLDVPTSRCLIGMVSSPSGLKLIVNNSSEDVTALGSSPNTTIIVGAATGDQMLNGRFQAFLGYSSPLSSGDLSRTRTWAQSLGAVFNASNILCFEGDSLSVGSIATLGRGWNQTLGLGGAAVQYNLAVPGQTMVQIASTARAQVLYNAAKRNVTVIFAGTNDIAGGATGAATYTSLSTYGGVLHSQGQKVVVVTMCPRNGLETQRQAFNNATRAGWTSWADALADVETVPALGAAGANTNTTYYNVDQVHLNNTGHAVLEGLAITQINTLMV